MKKLWVLLVIAGLVSACNNSGDGADDKKDSVLDVIDSSTGAKVDSIEETADSVKKMVEGTFEKTDSANRAIGDSTNKK